MEKANTLKILHHFFQQDPIVKRTNNAILPTILHPFLSHLIKLKMIKNEYNLYVFYYIYQTNTASTTVSIQ